MDDITIIIIFIFLIIISFIIIYINKKSNTIIYDIPNNDIKYPYNQFHNNSNPLLNPILNPNGNYYKEGNDDEIKEKQDGYFNELMYKNNLKDGNYKNQFNSNGLLNDNPFQNPISDYQIGFEPIAKNKSLTLPFANVNINCLT